MPSPRPQSIELAEDERVQLQSWARRRTSAAGLALRSRIVLAAAAGETNSAIAARLGVARSTAATWRNRFCEHRLDGLVDEPRPGRPRTVSVEVHEYHDADTGVLASSLRKRAPATPASASPIRAACGTSRHPRGRPDNSF